MAPDLSSNGISTQNMEVDDSENNSQGSQVSGDSCLQHYRELLKEIRDIQESDDHSIATAERINNVLKRVNQLVADTPLLERLKYEQVGLLDSKLMSCSSSILLKCLENLVVARVQYAPTEFCNKIINNITDINTGKLDFKLLLNDARAIIPELPLIQPSLSDFNSAPLEETQIIKVRKVRQTQREVVEKKQLEKIVSLQKDEQGVEETVSFLNTVLSREYEENNQNALSYYKYVVDKRSFEATVENIFHTAFLARDGKAQINIDDGNDIVIKPSEKKQLKKFRKEDGKNTQSIISFSVADWEKLAVDEGIIEKHNKNMKK